MVCHGARTHQDIMSNFTENEQKIIDAQGWNNTSLVEVLSSWEPYDRSREEHFAHVAAIENDESPVDYDDDSNLKRAVIVVEVLYDDRFTTDMSELSLGDINYEITTGHASGIYSVASLRGCPPEMMANLLTNQGSDPGFLLDEDEYDEDED